MAKDKGIDPTPFLVAGGIAAGIGGLFLLVRALRPPAVAVLNAIESATSGAQDAADAVADAVFNVEFLDEVQGATNQIMAIVAEQQAGLTDSLEDQLISARLDLVRLEASKWEAEQGGSVFALAPSLIETRGRIASLESQLGIS